MNILVILVPLALLHGPAAPGAYARSLQAALPVGLDTGAHRVLDDDDLPTR